MPQAKQNSVKSIRLKSVSLEVSDANCELSMRLYIWAWQDEMYANVMISETSCSIAYATRPFLVVWVWLARL